MEKENTPCDQEKRAGDREEEKRQTPPQTLVIQEGDSERAKTAEALAQLYTSPGFTVYLNVYDLLPPSRDSAKGLSAEVLNAMGMGLHHSGVEFLGQEYSFGSDESGRNDPHTEGIYSVFPRTACSNFKTQIVLGDAPAGFSLADVEDILTSLRPQWRSASYNILSHNCNHFTKQFVKAIDGYFHTDCPASLRLAPKYPSWVNRAAKSCNVVVPTSLVRSITDSISPPTACAPDLVNFIDIPAFEGEYPPPLAVQPIPTLRRAINKAKEPKVPENDDYGDEHGDRNQNRKGITDDNNSLNVNDTSNAGNNLNKDTISSGEEEGSGGVGDGAVAELTVTTDVTANTEEARVVLEGAEAKAEGGALSLTNADTRDQKNGEVDENTDEESTTAGATTTAAVPSPQSTVTGPETADTAVTALFGGWMSGIVSSISNGASSAVGAASFLQPQWGAPLAATTTSVGVGVKSNVSPLSAGGCGANIEGSAIAAIEMARNMNTNVDSYTSSSSHQVEGHLLPNGPTTASSSFPSPSPASLQQYSTAVSSGLSIVGKYAKRVAHTVATTVRTVVAARIDEADRLDYISTFDGVSADDLLAAYVCTVIHVNRLQTAKVFVATDGLRVKGAHNLHTFIPYESFYGYYYGAVLRPEKKDGNALPSFVPIEDVERAECILITLHIEDRGPSLRMIPLIDIAYLGGGSTMAVRGVGSLVVKPREVLKNAMAYLDYGYRRAMGMGHDDEDGDGNANEQLAQ